ncbi:MAG: alternative ribosome rescue aminoacyl-tRNA hydrolase ArfB, partial [Pacificimonas sp.]
MSFDRSRVDTLTTETFVMASGPGGQNVNKVATAVLLRFDLTEAPFPAAVKRRIAAMAGNRLTNDGDLLIRAEGHRTREANRREARQRLLTLLTKAHIRPKRRIPTRVGKGAKRRGTDAKVRRGRTKALRGRPARDD